MNGKFPEPAGNAKGSVLHSAGLLCSLLGMWDWIVIKDALRAVVEIFILWVFLYQIYRAFHATRGARIMVGLFACFLALVVLAFFFQLNVISWILTRIFAPGLALALVVIFQPELRVGLAKLGSHPFFSSFAKLQRVDFLDNFCKAVSKLSNQRFGALFAFERSISMKPIEDSGVKLDAIFSPELALTIFHTKTALHDGGVVISGDRISAAACVFPVSQKEMSDRTQRKGQHCRCHRRGRRVSGDHGERRRRGHVRGERLRGGGGVRGDGGYRVGRRREAGTQPDSGTVEGTP